MAHVCGVSVAFWTSASEHIHVVPDAYPTVQSAIDEAADGDVVLIRPGTYYESLRLAGKSIILRSEYSQSGDEEVVGRTILSGAIEEDGMNEGRAEQVILVETSARADTRIEGLTIIDGDDGIACHAEITISHCRFINNKDAIDYEGGGGICEDCFFERNEDDAIDVDQSTSVVIQNNRLVNNLDDGIEIRLHPHAGGQLNILIRNNVITNNAEDGIQIIDYPGHSKRKIRVVGNLIVRNHMAGIGFMSNANTRENYEAAVIPERIEIRANAIYDNHYGISASGNVLVRKNKLARHSAGAIKTQAANPATMVDNLVWN